MQQYAFLLLLFLCTPMLCAQQAGLPLIKNYNPEEYQAHRQNWAIAQDDRGVMYFANGEGLLIFDGENWSLEKVANQSHVRSLSTHNNKIFVGASNELGAFTREGATYQYTSYLEHVPDSLADFGRVWTTLVHKNAVYYQTDHFVLRVKEDGSSKVWNPKTALWKLLRYEGQLYLNIPEEGILVLDDSDNFIKTDKTEIFKMAATEFMLPMADGWLFEKRDALWYFDGSQISHYSNEAQEIFDAFGLNTALKTTARELVVAAYRKGCVILDEVGRLKHFITSENGLQHDVVRNVFEDKEGSLWLALDSGIARLDLGAPITYFDENSNLKGTVLDIQQFNGKLYAATSSGLMAETKGKFEKIGPYESIMRDMDTLQNQLIVANAFQPSFSVNASGELTIIDDSMVENGRVNLAVLPLKEDTNSAIIMFDTGLYQLRWDGLKWQVHQQLNKLDGEIKKVIQTAPGTLWLATDTKGFYRINYETSPEGIIQFEKAKIRNYYKEKNVPVGYNNMYDIKDQLLFLSKKEEIYHYVEELDDFQKVADLGSLLNLKYKNLYPERTERNGRAWLRQITEGDHYLIELFKAGENYTHERYPLSQSIQKFEDPYSPTSFQASNNIIYFGGSKGIIGCNLASVKEISTDLKVILNKVATSDSVYSLLEARNLPIEIPYNNSRLQFSYVMPSYKNAEEKRYQFQLEGFDPSWSEPSSTSSKEYTSLPPGKYIFKVKATNDYHLSSPETKLSFTVLRPWFWNSFSIPLYVLGLILLIYTFSQWRSRQLRQRNIVLKRKIEDAVKETKRQAEEIASLYEVKNQFFANISHELRTPLTLILGPSSDLLSDASLKSDQKNKVGFINNNANRLLHLINQLLDLSKLEAGKLDLRVSQHNIITTVSTMTRSFESMAVSQKIRLKFASEEKEIFVFYDRDKLEQVLVNLLSNALKFTEEGGLISVKVYKKAEHCLIEVKDSGIGIHEDQLPYIFDRFYQADHSASREHEGTGIGLSLTKELVELHGGTISADSRLGEGSSFIIQLPLGKSHFEEHQIAQFKPTRLQENPPIYQEVVLEEEKMEHQEVLLLVEDNQEMRTYIKGLMRANYHILEAENGIEGFEIAKKEVPDLIISDVMMPKMDGTELCQKLKGHEITSHIPVILLTAKASEEDKIKGLKIEADEYLAKPFNKAELAARVKNLILNRRKLQKRFANTTLIKPKEIAVTSMEEAFLEKLINLIEERIGDEGFGVTDLAKEMNLSRSQVHRKIQSITNQPPSLFIRKYRLERAKQLLQKGAGRVSDIAYEVGFSSPSYFTKCFTETFGYTPKEAAKNR